MAGMHDGRAMAGRTHLNALHDVIHFYDFHKLAS